MSGENLFHAVVRLKVPLELPTERLQAVLRPHRVSADGCGVALRYDGDGARALIRLGSDWQVLPDDAYGGVTMTTVTTATVADTSLSSPSFL